MDVFKLVSGDGKLVERCRLMGGRLSTDEGATRWPHRRRKTTVIDGDMDLKVFRSVRQKFNFNLVPFQVQLDFVNLSV